MSSLLLIIVLCFGLFFLDEDTHSVADLFKTGNLFVMVLYVVPTYFICLLIYYFLEKKRVKQRSVIALTTGIPIGLSLVILVWLALMGRL